MVDKKAHRKKNIILMDLFSKPIYHVFNDFGYTTLRLCILAIYLMLPQVVFLRMNLSYNGLLISSGLLFKPFLQSIVLTIN